MQHITKQRAFTCTPQVYTANKGHNNRHYVRGGGGALPQLPTTPLPPPESNGASLWSMSYLGWPERWVALGLQNHTIFQVKKLSILITATVLSLLHMT